MFLGLRAGLRSHWFQPKTIIALIIKRFWTNGCLLFPAATVASTVVTTCSTVRRGRWFSTWPPLPLCTTDCSTVRGSTSATTTTSSAWPSTRSKTTWPPLRYDRPIVARLVFCRRPFLIGCLVCQVGRDPAVHVWDVQTLKCLSLLRGHHSRGVCALEFTGVSGAKMKHSLTLINELMLMNVAICNLSRNTVTRGTAATLFSKVSTCAEDFRENVNVYQTYNKSKLQCGEIKVNISKLG